MVPMSPFLQKPHWDVAPTTSSFRLCKVETLCSHLSAESLSSRFPASDIYSTVASLVETFFSTPVSLESFQSCQLSFQRQKNLIFFTSYLINMHNLLNCIMTITSKAGLGINSSDSWEIFSSPSAPPPPPPPPTPALSTQHPMGLIIRGIF